MKRILKFFVMALLYVIFVACIIILSPLLAFCLLAEFNDNNKKERTES